MAKAKSLDRTTYSCFQFHPLLPHRASPRRSRYRSASIISTVFPISLFATSPRISPAHPLSLCLYHSNRISNFIRYNRSTHLPCAPIAPPFLSFHPYFQFHPLPPLRAPSRAPIVSTLLSSQPDFYSNRIYNFTRCCRSAHLSCPHIASPALSFQPCFHFLHHCRSARSRPLCFRRISLLPRRATWRAMRFPAARRSVGGRALHASPAVSHGRFPVAILSGA